MNKAILIGRVGADPEIRSTQGGKVASLRLATSERWKDKNGERKEKTEWHSVVIWGDGLAGVVERFVSKGDQLAIEGQIQTRKWQDSDGNNRYSTEIVVSNGGRIELLGGSGNGDDRRDDRGRGPSRNDAIDDEIPF